MGTKYVIENFGLNNTKFTLCSLFVLYFFAFVSGLLFVDYYNDNVDEFLFLANSRMHDLYFRCNSFKVHTFVLVFEFYHYLHFMTLVLLSYLVFVQLLFLYFLNFWYDWYFLVLLSSIKQFLFNRMYFFSFLIFDIKNLFHFCFDFVSSILDKNLLDFENIWNLVLRMFSFWLDGLMFLEYNKFASFFVALFVLYVSIFFMTMLYVF